jgi:serine protease inhibitor
MSDEERNVELEELLESLCDGSLASAGHARLQALLREDLHSRERAAEVLELEGLLRWHYGAAGTLGTSEHVQRAARASGRWARRRWAAVLVVAAAAALVLAMLPLWREGSSTEPDVAVALAPQWEVIPSGEARYTVLAPDLVQLDRGELFIRERTGDVAPPIDIRTSVATASARDTSFFISTCSSEEDTMIRDITRVLVLGGTVTLTNTFGQTEAGAGALAVADHERAPSQVVAEGANAFACDLYAKIAAANPSRASFCYSPYSIATALTMLLEGAAGETADELAAALHVPEAARRQGDDVARIQFEWNLLHTGHSELRALFDSAARARTVEELRAEIAELGARRDQFEQRFEATSDGRAKRALRQESIRVGEEAKALQARIPTYSLDVANALWVDRSHPFAPAYTAALDSAYGTGTAQIADFRNAPIVELKRINGWVREHTGGRIPRLVSSQDISSQTSLVLANALAFAGEWLNPFEVSRTEEAPFTSSDGVQRNVPLMQGTIGQARYGAFEASGEAFATPHTIHTGEEPRYPADEGFQAVELPYGGGDVALLVLLPRSSDGLAELEARLTPSALAQWRGALEERSATIALPRFSIDTRLELREVLQALGVRRAFRSPDRADGAELPHITTSSEARDRVFVEQVIHGAALTVNEAGAEGSAATVVTPNVGGTARAFVPRFRADHGFVYAVVHVPTGLVLFAGRFDGA